MIRGKTVRIRIKSSPSKFFLRKPRPRRFQVHAGFDHGAIRKRVRLPGFPLIGQEIHFILSVGPDGDMSFFVEGGFGLGFGRDTPRDEESYKEGRESLKHFRKGPEKSGLAWERKIVHVDMDAFFAAVEQRDHPQYRGRPVVVGGDPKSRGVVSTASYEARKFGIHSAMPSAAAYRLCPEAVFLRPRFEVYQSISETIHSILKQHTQLVEKVSLDEAYLDVTSHRFGIEDPEMVAALIKQNIYAVTRLTASAGVAPNMLLAKIASDYRKPDGLTVVRPGEAGDFLEALPVRKIPGVGPVTEKTLNGLGIKTCGELAAKSSREILRVLGRPGLLLLAGARGMDDRPVEPRTEPKQMSLEETFDRDTRNMDRLKDRLREFSREVFRDLAQGRRMGKTVVLKLKYYDFESITRSLTLSREPRGWHEIYDVGVSLLERTDAGRKPVRLIGLGISGLKPLEAIRRSETPDLFSAGEISS